MARENVVFEELEQEVGELEVERDEKRSRLTYGSVSVHLGGQVTLPERAGQLSTREMSRVPRSRKGLGLACDVAADAMEKASEIGFQISAGVTPESLREAGRQAEAIDLFIRDAEVLLHTLKQANLLLDAEAYEQLRRLNAHIKAQRAFSPELDVIFQGLRSYFIRGKAGLFLEEEDAAEEEAVS